jgi:hypothetical protein
MKKWMIYLLPLLLVICSIGALFFTKHRIEQFVAMSRQMPIPMDVEDLVQEESFNRPAAFDPIYPKVALLLLNGMPEEVYNLVKQAQEKIDEPQIKFASTQLAWETMHDLDFNYQTLQSGLNPLRADAFLKIASRESDALLKIVQDYGFKAYTTDVLQELSYPEKDWEDASLIILNASNDSWASATFEAQEMADQIIELIQQTDPDTLLVISSLIPKPHLPPSLKPRYHYTVPLAFVGSKVDPSVELQLMNVQELTATLAYALGLPSPTGCMAVPCFTLFPQDDKDLLDRMLFSGHNYLGNALYGLSDFGLDESISEGYFFQYSDKLEYAKSTDYNEMLSTIQQMDQDYREFLDNENRRANMFPTIISVILLALLLIAWLLLLPYFYRGMLFGLLWLVVWLAFFHIVFRMPLQLPSLHQFSWIWILSTHLWPLIVSTIVLAAGMTLIAGFWLDLQLKDLFIDLQSAAGTFLVFLLAQGAFFSIRDGFVIGRIIPAFYTQALIFRNLSHIILLPLLFGLMLLIASSIYGISLKIAQKRG